MKQLVIKINIDLDKDLDDEQLAEIESDVLDYLGDHDHVKWGSDDNRSGAEMSASAKMKEVVG